MKNNTYIVTGDGKVLIYYIPPRVRGIALHPTS